MIKRLYKDKFHFSFFIVESTFGSGVDSKYLYKSRGYTLRMPTVTIKNQLMLFLQNFNNF